MYEIEITKKYNIPGAYLFEEAVEKILKEDSKIAESKNRDSERVYEINGGGVVLYNNFNFEHQYCAIIKLAGFVFNTEKFEDLKSKLEEISRIDNPELIRKKFLDNQ